MPARKGEHAPFEIMSRANAGAARPSHAPASADIAADSVDDDASSLAGRWKQPHAIVLRVPQGYAVLFVVALLGLVVLSYMVGYSRGDKASDADIAQLVADRMAEREQTIRLGSTSGQGDVARSGQRPSQSLVVEPGADPRTPGLNYLILATYPRDEAIRLSMFINQQGLDTAVFPVHNSSTQYQVIALRGFDRSGLHTSEYDAYKQMLHRLGRQWKRDAKGPDDLNSMYAARYGGSASSG